MINFDVDGFSRNLSLLQDDLLYARWYGTSDQKVVPDSHASAYFPWMGRKSSQVDKEALANVVNDDLYKKGSRISIDVWKDQGILYHLYLGSFFLILHLKKGTE